jgi:hypothetical protein
MTDKRTDLERKIDILDDMIGALVDLLEDNGLINGDEWEKMLKERLEEGKKLKRID